MKASPLTPLRGEGNFKLFKLSTIIYYLLTINYDAKGLSLGIKLVRTWVTL